MNGHAAMPREIIFVSESVTPGHPDKLCDQISDAAIDAYLRQDGEARAVVECAMATGIVFLAARQSAQASVDLAALARAVIADAGYAGNGFDAQSCSILVSLTQMSAEERTRGGSDGSAAADTLVAAEQANMFGYACRDTAALMPLPITLAHRLAQRLDAARVAGAPFLGPDGKTQVAVEYRDGRPVRLRDITVTVALADETVGQDTLAEAVRELVVRPALADMPLADGAAPALHINPSGTYLVGGPAKHAGLTGRKNGIDTYGEIARQSGAALSGKDPSRVDRSGAYAARHAAKQVVAAGLADRCEVHLAYSIGVARPVSLSVNSFGTGTLDDEAIAARLERTLDFRPSAIVRRLDLRQAPRRAGAAGFYRRLAVYGHLGRPDLDLPWERIDAAEALKD